MADWLQIGSSIATVLGLIFVGIQIAQGNKRRSEDLRPYIQVSVNKSKSGSRLIGELSIRNTGQTPALNVKLEFPGDANWQNVNNPSLYSFTQTEGIHKLNPGQEFIFYLGPITTKIEPGSRLLDTSVDVKITYKTGTSRKTILEIASVTLSDKGYLLRSS
jgi:hypothetical protein